MKMVYSTLKYSDNCLRITLVPLTIECGELNPQKLVSCWMNCRWNWWFGSFGPVQETIELSRGRFSYRGWIIYSAISRQESTKIPFGENTREYHVDDALPHDTFGIFSLKRFTNIESRANVLLGVTHSAKLMPASLSSLSSLAINCS